MPRLTPRGHRIYCRCFNMIEVALAMAIIAFGMTSILGLFPVGMNASRNAIAENASIDSIEQFAGYIRSLAESNSTNFDNLFTNGGATPLPTVTGLPTAAAIDTATAAFLDQFRIDRTTNQIAGFSLYNSLNSDGTLNPAIYFVVQGPDGSANCDFMAMLKVWRSPVSMNFRIDSSAVTNPARTNNDVNYGWGGGLNIEISWPLSKNTSTFKGIPYAERQKRYYYIDIIRP